MATRNARFALFLPLATALVLACASSSNPSVAQGAAISASAVPSLGAAASFAVLAGTAATCTNATITGDVGVFPGTAVTQTSCALTGAVHAGDAVAAQAHNDFVLAYDAFKALPCDQTFTDVTIGNATFTPGVYCYQAALTSTGGVVTLDGPANGIWIFKIGTLGTGALTGTGFTVVMKDGTAPPCNSVYWWVAEAATMTDSKFVGTILAGAAITLTGGTFDGDALAKAAVTLTGANATACATAGGGGATCGKRTDFVTGGGWLSGDKPKAKKTFAVTGGIKHDAFWGHLTYEDHGTGLKVKGTGVTAYIALDAITRRIQGTAEVNGMPGFTYQVDVSDNGKTARDETDHGKPTIRHGDDTFSIALSNGYGASDTLGGGNIRLHTRGDDDSCKGGRGGDDDKDGNDGDDDDQDE